MAAFLFSYLYIIFLWLINTWFWTVFDNVMLIVASHYCGFYLLGRAISSFKGKWSWFHFNNNFSNNDMHGYSQYRCIYFSILFRMDYGFMHALRYLDLLVTWKYFML